MDDKVKRGLIISGGGSWGAYGAGTIAALNKKYNIIGGISTGAMMSPLVALNKFDVLEEAYTSVTDKDIFDLKWYKPKPLTKKGKANMFAILNAILFGKESLATAYNMRKLIDKFLTKDDYYRIIDEGKNVIIGTQNLRENPSKIHYFDMKDCGFEDFKDWMWASASAPFYTNLVNKEWKDEYGKTHMGQWTDGGVSELIAFNEVIDKMERFKGDEREIDIIIHRSIPVSNYNGNKICDLIDNVNGVINAMRYDIEFENLIEKAKQATKWKKIDTNIYFLPRKLSSNAMMFNKKQMKSWWEEGYKNVNDETKVVRFKSKK